jgi:hypothetical protein
MYVVWGIFSFQNSTLEQDETQVWLTLLLDICFSFLNSIHFMLKHLTSDNPPSRTPIVQDSARHDLQKKKEMRTQ